jgi:hypothetical protein
MAKPVRVEVVSRDGFWRKAVMIEWQYQFPERTLVAEPDDTYLVPEDWLDDFARVAGECFSKVVRAPVDPSRRFLFRRLFAPGDRR